ncbi:hypothetical protein AD929_12875 [Gluconobacter potus]|uniref:Uncharacterized protein n=2 Tax=Gluconobacter potus TaxID=2724927 RepID=A0A149QSL5_9PROT|nr:hypothetical protein AD929_12875 [Gluconobacter potus]
MKCHKGKLRQGFGLLETLLSVFLAALIICAAVLLYQQAERKYVTGEFQKEVIELVKATKTVYGQASQEDFENIHSYLVMRAASVSHRYINGSEFTSPVHGLTSIVWNGNNTYAIYFWNVPAYVCPDLIHATSSYGSDFHFLQINGSYQFGSMGSWMTEPSSTQANTACSGDNNMLIYVFQL